jgi:hypothetical protein
VAKTHVRTVLLTDHRMVDLYIGKALKPEPVDITIPSTDEPGATEASLAASPELSSTKILLTATDLSVGERALAQTDRITFSQSTKDLAGYGRETVDMGLRPVKGRKDTASVCQVTSLSTL